MNKNILIVPILFLLALSFANATANLTDPVMVITFDNANFNGTHHLDQSGNGNHLEVRTGSTQGVAGYAGQADSVTITGENYGPLTFSGLENQFSYCAAYSFDVINGQQLFGSDYSGSTGGGFDIYIPNAAADYLLIYMDDGINNTEWRFDGFTDNPASAEYDAYCFSIDGQGQNHAVYRNGVSLNRTLNSANATVNANLSDGMGFLFGVGSAVWNDAWNGSIDEVSFYGGLFDISQVDEATPQPTTPPAEDPNADASRAISTTIVLFIVILLAIFAASFIGQEKIQGAAQKFEVAGVNIGGIVLFILAALLLIILL